LKKLRVLQLIDSLSPGGSETMAVNIANALICNDVDSFICTSRKEGKLIANIDNQVGYIFLNKKNKIDFKAILKLREYVVKNKIKIIHAHSSSFFLAMLVKLTYPKIKLCWHDHFGFSDILSQRKSFILKICSLFFNHIFVVNTNLKKWAMQNLWQKQISYLPNFASFSNDNKDTKLKGKKGKRIICLANLRPQKDHHSLIKAFAEFCLNHRYWTLHLVGLDLGDNYSKSIKNLITEHNLQKNIFIYGSRSDIKNILSQATIGVLSSISEGLPVSLLEYGLAKLPVLCTDVGECASVITYELSGFIVPPRNIKKFTFYLSKLAEDRDLRATFGLRLNADIKKEYSKEKFTQKILKIYKDI
jgi:glycosyltransferase involved in cell wall biosynthesis